jgi:exonuclease VII small subunit|nr:MAG TPA: tail length tape measure protein [Caudoviricetes sp.]
MAVPVELEIFMKDLTKAGLQSVGKNVDDVENQTMKLIDALKLVRAEQIKQLEANKQAGKSYTQEAANVQALTGQINGLKAGLKDLQKTKEETAKTPSIDIDTEAVTRKTNNLKMQFSQVARELPSLAMGPQMFILAISNNLPMLADAIADVRKQNELLAASGQKGVPVWKQLGKALLSPQTALIALISLGIVYGKEIGNWVKNLGKAKKELSETQQLQESLNTSRRKGGEAASEESAKLRILYTASQDTSKSMRERNKAVDELQKMYPDYFGKLSNEAILAGNAASAYDELTKAIIRKGQAQAAEDIVADYSKRNYQLQRGINADSQWVNQMRSAYEAALKQREGMRQNALTVNQSSFMTNRTLSGDSNAEKIIEEYERRMENIRKSSEEIAKNNKTVEGIVKQIDTSAYTTDFSGSSKKQKEEKTDYASQLADARVKAQQTTEKLRIQIMQEGIAKRMAMAKQEYDESVADIDKQERDMLAKMDQARKQGDNIPQSQYDDVKNTANTNRMLAEQVYNEKIYQIEQEYRDKATQSLIDYNKQYGTYQEKRLAIAMDYARKIAAAETEGEADVLTRERDDKLASLDFEEMKKGMDWDKIFGDLDRVSTDTLESLREKLKEYLEGIGDDISPESFKEVMDAFKDIDSELADRSPFETMKKGYEDYKSAMEEVRSAQNLLQQAQMGGSVIVEEYDEETGELTRKLITQAEAEERLRAAQDKRYSAQKSLTDAAHSIGQKGMAVVNAGNDIVEMLGNFGVKVPEAVSETLNGVSQVMSGLESIDLTKPFSAITGSIKILTGIGNTIAGLFGFGGADYSGYENLKSKYEGLIDIWDSLISKKQQYIDIDYGIEAQKAAEEAKKLVDVQIERQRQLMHSLSGSGSSMFSHSLGYRVNERMGSSDWARLSQLTGANIREFGDVIDLDADVIGKVLQDEKFVSVLTAVNSEFVTYIENIDKYSEQLKEIAEQEKEAFTGVSFDEFRDSFVSMLSDLDATNQDFADNFEKYLQNAIFSSMVADKYKDRIQSLYDSWAKEAADGEKVYVGKRMFGLRPYIEKDKGLSNEEAEMLRNQYQSIVDDMLAEREQIMNAFGWSSSADSGSSQSPSSGALTTMSQDSISTFEGIGRNMQTHLANTDKFVQEIRNTQKQDSQTLATIAGHTAHLVEIHEILSDMKLNGIILK